MASTTYVLSLEIENKKEKCINKNNAFADDACCNLFQALIFD